MNTEKRTTRPPSSRISRLAPHNSTTTDACIPIAIVSRADANTLGLDARALFMLGFINDRTPVFELLTMSGLPLDDAADALATLCDVGAVALADGQP